MHEYKLIEFLWASTAVFLSVIQSLNASPTVSSPDSLLSTTIFDAGFGTGSPAGARINAETAVLTHRLISSERIYAKRRETCNNVQDYYHCACFMVVLEQIWLWTKNPRQQEAMQMKLISNCFSTKSFFCHSCTCSCSMGYTGKTWVLIKNANTMFYGTLIVFMTFCFYVITTTSVSIC